MITSIDINNYKCFSRFSMDHVGRLCVLVGPNDSGKTAFLEAIRLLTLLTPKGSANAETFGRDHGIDLGRTTVWRQTGEEVQITAHAGPKEEESGQIFRVSWTPGKNLLSDVIGTPFLPDQLPTSWKSDFFKSYLGLARYYHFDPAALRQASPMSTAMTEIGEGFPTLVANMKLSQTSLFAEMEEDFKYRFQHYKRIDIRPTSRMEARQRITGQPFAVEQDGYVFSFVTNHDERLPATSVSDGVMVSLAFMALSHAAEPPKILLIEEPENHVHPDSLKEIVRTLRELSERKGVQVFLTSHSPYLVDLVEPEEVRIFVKGKGGAVHASRLSECPDIDEMKKHFMTGEIWTSLGEKEIVDKVRGQQ